LLTQLTLISARRLQLTMKDEMRGQSAAASRPPRMTALPTQAAAAKGWFERERRRGSSNLPHSDLFGSCM
jgi:hypothetical protein